MFTATIQSLVSLPAPGTGYFVAPSSGPGPGVLMLPSPWGLTSSMKRRADELADAGFSVLVPDVNGGATATDEAQAQQTLLALDVNVAASLIQSSLLLLRRTTADPDSPIGIVGFAAGASWALWLSERRPAECCAIVGFYGTQSIDFAKSSSSYLLHFGTADDVVSDDEIAMLGLSLQQAGRSFQIEHHVGAHHGFAESEHPNFDPAVESIAWRQTLEFLAQHLNR